MRLAITVPHKVALQAYRSVMHLGSEDAMTLALETLQRPLLDWLEERPHYRALVPFEDFDFPNVRSRLSNALLDDNPFRMMFLDCGTDETAAVELKLRWSDDYVIEEYAPPEPSRRPKGLPKPTLRIFPAGQGVKA